MHFFLDQFGLRVYEVINGKAVECQSNPVRNRNCLWLIFGFVELLAHSCYL